MHLYRNGNYIDTQEDGKEIVRYDLRSSLAVQALQEKAKGGFDLAITNPGEIVDSNTMQIL